MKSNGTFAGIELLIIDETPNFSNRITEKPIEDGADIADHIYQNPLTLNVEFIVTENASEKINQLREIRDSNEIYSYSGVNFELKNMAVENFDVPINANIKDGFQTSISLKQVRVIEERGAETILGEDPVTGNQVQKDNEETVKRQYQRAHILR